MSRPTAELVTRDGFAATRLTLINPETGEMVGIDVAPSLAAEVRATFPGLDEGGGGDG